MTGPIVIGTTGLTLGAIIAIAAAIFAVLMIARVLPVDEVTVGGLLVALAVARLV